MKPTLSIALLALGLTFPAPALAIDYLQCEAMARVMAGANHNIWQAERRWRNRVTAAACPPESFTKPLKSSLDDLLPPIPSVGKIKITDHAALEKCKTDFLAVNYSVKGELMGVKTYSPEGARLAASHSRAASHRQAAGCP